MSRSFGKLSEDARGAVDAAAQVIAKRFQLTPLEARVVAREALEAALPHMIYLAEPYRSKTVDN